MAEEKIEHHSWPESLNHDQVRAVLVQELERFEQVMRDLLDKHHDNLRATYTEVAEATEFKQDEIPSAERQQHPPEAYSISPSAATSTKKTDLASSGPLDNASEADAELQRPPTPGSSIGTSRANAKLMTHKFKKNTENLETHSGTHEALSKLTRMGTKKLRGGKKLITRALDLVNWMEKTAEPERTSWLGRIVTGRLFEFTCLTVVMVHGMLFSLTLSQQIESWNNPGTPAAIMSARNEEVIDIGFLTFYIAELALRLYVHKQFFFIGEESRWNVLDFFLVIISIIEFLLARANTGDASNFVVLRQIRLLRLVRVLRILRALRFLSELRQMMLALCSSLATLSWCIILIVFIQYIFSMIFVQGFAEYLQEQGVGNVDPDLQEVILEYFADVRKGILSLFMAVTGGQDWVFFYDLVALTGWWRAVFFCFYICFFAVAAVNIITATFVDKAFKLAQPDLEDMMIERMKQARQDARELRKVFDTINEDHDNKISREEAIRMIDGPWQHLLQARGVDADDGETFYTLLTQGSDTDIDVDTFINGCLHMKGFATSIDVSVLEYKIDQFHDNLLRALDILETTSLGYHEHSGSQTTIEV